MNQPRVRRGDRNRISKCLCQSLNRKIEMLGRSQRSVAIIEEAQRGLHVVERHPARVFVGSHLDLPKCPMLKLTCRELVPEKLIRSG